MDVYDMNLNEMGSHWLHNLCTWSMFYVGL